MTKRRNQSSNSVKANSSVRTLKAQPPTQLDKTQDGNTKLPLDLRGGRLLTGSGQTFMIGGIKLPTERKP